MASELYRAAEISRDDMAGAGGGFIDEKSWAVDDVGHTIAPLTPEDSRRLTAAYEDLGEFLSTDEGRLGKQYSAVRKAQANQKQREGEEANAGGDAASKPGSQEEQVELSADQLALADVTIATSALLSRRYAPARTSSASGVCERRCQR